VKCSVEWRRTVYNWQFMLVIRGSGFKGSLSGIAPQYWGLSRYTDGEVGNEPRATLPNEICCLLLNISEQLCSPWRTSCLLITSTSINLNLRFLSMAQFLRTLKNIHSFTVQPATCNCLESGARPIGQIVSVSKSMQYSWPRLNWPLLGVHDSKRGWIICRQERYRCI
jgi:hypothetical protein